MEPGADGGGDKRRGERDTAEPRHAAAAAMVQLRCAPAEATPARSLADEPQQHPARRKAGETETQEIIECQQDDDSFELSVGLELRAKSKEQGAKSREQGVGSAGRLGCSGRRPR